MFRQMMIDADICIKLGGSEKHLFLVEVIPLLAEETYMHKNALGEVMMPPSAVRQLSQLVEDGTIRIVDETILSSQDRLIYDMTYKKLERVMIDPRFKNKNLGEVCSLAFAKAKSIPVFATDEMDLQHIVDRQLNSGMDDIKCLRIIDIIHMAKSEEINVKRKVAKALWVISGKEKDKFDQSVWPL